MLRGMKSCLWLLPLLLPLACSSDGDSSPGGGGGSSGSLGGSAGSSGVAGGGGGDAGSGGLAGAAGSAGSGGAPSCDEPPASEAQKSIAEIWQQNPAAPSLTWVSGVYITAISGSACSATTACQLFVQSAESFASFDAGAQQALRVVVFPPAVAEFTALGVGDRIDLYASAWRHTSGGQNELMFEISSTYPGCAKKVGSGDPAGTPGATLEQLTQAAYETTHGPLLVKLDGVSGKPKGPTELFALWKSFQIGDGGIESVVSLSPYFLPNHSFTGLNQDSIHNFESVQAVFGLFMPQGSSTKYKVLYIRSMADAPFGGQ
jgi:hypothetical protein